MKKKLSISALNAENQIINDSQIKAAIPNTCVSILKKVENLSRNKAQKIKLVDISLLSNCNNFIKPKDLKPKCIQKILNPYIAKIKWGK
jgi:rRNA-processing protein FCF1